jgi:hypothetical protein
VRHILNQAGICKGSNQIFSHRLWTVIAVRCVHGETPDTCSVKNVPHLRRSVTSSFRFPALPGWAEVWFQPYGLLKCRRASDQFLHTFRSPVSSPSVSRRLMGTRLNPCPAVRWGPSLLQTFKLFPCSCEKKSNLSRADLRDLGSRASLRALPLNTFCLNLFRPGPDISYNSVVA